jgi:uncharacterized protein (TIGR03437 family)
MRTLLLIYTLATVSIHAQQIAFEKTLSANLTAVDAKGNIYAANSGTVTKLNPDGSTAYSNSLAFSATWAGIAVDAPGNLVIVGTTSNDTLPTTTAVLQPKRDTTGTCVTSGQTTQTIPCPDAFVAKLDPSGNLLWATYLGGSAADQANGVAVDSNGNIFVVGVTFSPNFPTVSGLQTRFGGDADGFITKITPDGSKILYSSTIGGSMHDIAHAVAVDPDGNAYVAGEGQIGIPSTAGSFGKDCANTGVHAFLIKIAPSGSLVYGGCIGSAGNTSAATAVAVDSTDNAYIGGVTTASDFPLTSGAFDGSAVAPSSDFIGKVSADGASLVYSSLLDGASPGIYSIAVDSTGAAYAAGATASSSATAITGPALQPCAGPSNSGFNFLLKLNPAGSSLNYFSYENGLQPFISIALATDGSLVEAAGAVVRKFSSLAAGGGLYLSPLCVLNGASLISHFQIGQPGVSPGELVTLEGVGLGPQTGVTFNASSGAAAPTSLGGTQVLFDGVPAPIVSAQDRQVTVIAPYALSSKTQTSIQVVYHGKTSKAVTVPVSPISVAVLSDPATGRPQVLNGDLSPNSNANPASAGGVIVIFVTGAGQTLPPSLDGQMVQGPGTLGVNTTAVLQNRSTGLVNLPITVLYAGPAPGRLAAIQQVKVQIPSDLPSYFLTGAGGGQTYLQVSFGSQAITVPVVIH